MSPMEMLSCFIIPDLILLYAAYPLKLQRSTAVELEQVEAALGSLF